MFIHISGVETFQKEINWQQTVLVYKCHVKLIYMCRSGIDNSKTTMTTERGGTCDIET